MCGDAFMASAAQQVSYADAGLRRPWVILIRGLLHAGLRYRLHV